MCPFIPGTTAHECVPVACCGVLYTSLKMSSIPVTHRQLVLSVPYFWICLLINCKGPGTSDSIPQTSRPRTSPRARRDRLPPLQSPSTGSLRQGAPADCPRQRRATAQSPFAFPCASLSSNNAIGCKLLRWSCTKVCPWKDPCSATLRLPSQFPKPPGQMPPFRSVA